MMSWQEAKDFSDKHKYRLQTLSYEEIVEQSKELMKIKVEAEEDIDNNYHDWIAVNMILGVVAEILVQRIDDEMRGTFLGLADSSAFLS